MLLRKPAQLSNPRFVAWPSGLSLAAEQSIEVGSRSMDFGFVPIGRMDLWKKDMFKVGKLKAILLFSCGLCCFAVVLDR